MNTNLNKHYGIGYHLMVVLSILAIALGGQTSVSVSAQANPTAPVTAPVAAPVSTLTLSVVSADDSATYTITKGDAITEFKYIINIDNSGTTAQRSPAPGTGCSPTDAGYPGTCNWVSVAGRANHSPIYTQGDQGDFVGGVLYNNGVPVQLPAGRYLISVLADNYKIDGEHFTIPSATGNVTVHMQPYDLPTATVQAAVFEDMAPTNSAPDVPGERGLAGFKAHIKDYIDEVTTDIFGNPLGAEYDTNGDYIPGTGGSILSKCYVIANGLDIGTVNPVDAFGRCPIAFTTAEDPLLGSNITQTVEHDPIPVGAVIEGKVIIPNVGPNRYALSVTPPDNSNWIQTTTLEGNHDWDAWVMEGATGLDTEFVVGGEPFPATFFGFVRPSINTMGPGTGTVKGIGLAVSAYIPPTGGITGEAGLLGAKAKDKNPIHRLFVSLSDLNNGDQTVFVGEFDCVENAGCLPPAFSIPNVPEGDYVLGVWDEPQDYIFLEQNVSIKNGEVVDLGALSMLGWWTTIEGHVFNDLNENGKMDAGEPGIPGFPIVMRTRENSIMDRGTVAVTTDASGYYWMESAYPMTQWLVEEAYADGFQTTGITYQADNQPTETTVLGAGVDVNVHPVIGLGGRFDWGVKAYAPGTNGGIVGTVSYDTTRNELNPQYAAIEDWQPSISDLNVDLYAPVACGTNSGAPCDENGLYELNQDGSYAFGDILNQYVTESWERPSGCVARNVDGNPLVHGIDENALPLAADAPCLEAPMMGLQFGPMAGDVGTPDENFGASVDGNYGFGDGCFLANGNPGLFDTGTGLCTIGTLQPLRSNRDYLVRVEIPDDSLGRPMYKVTREEDINIANGDSFVPQVPPSSCAGSLHIVNVAADGNDNYPQIIGDGGITNDVPAGVIVPASTPLMATENPTFIDIGGSVYEGQPKPLCDVKLVRVSDRKSIAPGFNLFTDVPLPGRFWGLLVDDLNFSSNPQSLAYGEKLGIPFAPIGIYDYTNRLITTVESDYNGLFDVLLPSTNRISCPTPSGVCANLYRFEGNDPGVPGHWNANYTPQYRSISAEFEAFAGLTIPADLAPTTVAVAVQIPGSQTLSPVSCTLDAAQPQLLAVSKPYANASGSDSFMIDGYGFGASVGQVLLDNVVLPVTPANWTDGHIAVTVPSTVTPGVHQLSVMATNGMKTVNGLAFHVMGSSVAVSPFPANATPLDAFTNRNNLGANWNSNGGGFDVINNSGTANDYLRIRTGNGNGVSNAWWTNGAALGTSQEAYFTFTKVSGRQQSTEQGLLLKYSGGANPNANSARWIEVALDNNNDPDPEAMTVRVRTKLGNNITDQLVISGANAVFSNGDQLGARALSDGTIIVYKNGSEIGRVTVGATSGLTGRIGLRFQGTGNSNAVDARIDNFGGGNVTVTANTGSNPSLFEVGPGKPYSNIQSAIDAAASQSPNKDSLVVVYPNAADPNNPRYNGRGAYYENLIMYAPIQLQGVGPGGVTPTGTIIPGSIIDGIAFGGDTTLATNWLGKISALAADPDTNPNGGWSGNQDINDGQVIYVLASNTGSSSLTRAGSFSSTTFKPSIDGFNIRGGDQQGLAGNLNAIFGGFPGPIQALQVQTQGGAIFANSYVRNLQITNNVIEGNGGSYGAIRIGTPTLPAPDTDNQNDNVRIANNRILANGGTNLAGAIGLFNGAENYDVANNDLCGNFSAEYGGAISHFGLSPNGKIHDNRIYFNRSYDEGAGIMIAGELAANPLANYGTTSGAKGSGAVSIYNNLIQANLSDDDGGGVRFLMAGNFPMNVYNNMIVNNVSTHEGGGVAVDDAPNVRFYNNTVMKNITTATSLLSDGLPAPAGLSTGPNSNQLQATLPSGSPLFSNPLLFNNIFWDNRAGSKGVNTVVGIGTAGDATPINNWDMGVYGAADLLAPTNTLLQSTLGITASPTNNVGADPAVITTHDIAMSFTSWRTNVNFVGAIMVTADLNPTQLGNYHLLNTSSPAANSAAASKAVPSYQQAPATLAAPTIDIDNQGRPGGTGFDKGADEVDGTVIGGGGGGGTPALPTLTVLDNFNRANANTLNNGSNWSQSTSGGVAALKVNTNQALCTPASGFTGIFINCTLNGAMWNNPTGGFGAKQGAAFTFANTPINGSSLILKATGGSANSPGSFIRVQYNGTQAVVQTSTNSGVTYTTVSSFAATFVNGDTLTVVANTDGSVDVWKTTAANVTTYLGHSSITAFTGSGRIGIYIPNNARVDDFKGQTVP
ncbi:MAG: SdrD B-like domain-containing protein [Chloroflexota bacterium]